MWWDRLKTAECVLAQMEGWQVMATVPERCQSEVTWMGVGWVVVVTEAAGCIYCRYNHRRSSQFSAFSRLRG